MARQTTQERRAFLLQVGLTAVGAAVVLGVLHASALVGVVYVVAAQLALRMWVLVADGLPAGPLLKGVLVWQGLRDDRLVVHFQPKVAARSGLPVGVEALCRIAHPRRGLLTPDAWIEGAHLPWLERRFWLHTLEAALAEVRRWNLDAGFGLVVSINITPHSFEDERLPADLVAAMERHAVSPANLLIELTEDALVLSDKAIANAQRLNALGVALALDDFGTGHSSMERLVRLPVRELKIDRRFVTNQMSSPRDAAVVRGAIELCRALGLDAVAEGVEHDHDVETLRRLGCDLLQGHFYSRAIPADALVDWLLDQRAAVAGVAIAAPAAAE